MMGKSQPDGPGLTGEEPADLPGREGKLKMFYRLQMVFSSGLFS
jgi:hypothetical protein